MSVGRWDGGAPQGPGSQDSSDVPDPLQVPTGASQAPKGPWEGRSADSAATHTGSCRGCWSPSWTAAWSGRPSGGPPCVQRGTGTSCLHCPWSRSCRAEEFKGELLPSAQTPCSPRLVTHFSGNGAMESHGSSSGVHVTGASHGDPGCPVRFLKLCRASGGQERQPHLPPLSPASLPPLHPLPRGPPLGPCNCIPCQKGEPQTHLAWCPKPVTAQPTLQPPLQSTRTCVSCPPRVLSLNTPDFHSGLSLQFLSPLMRSLHSQSSSVHTTPGLCLMPAPTNGAPETRTLCP